MLGLFILAFLLVPVAELAVFANVASRIGFGPTFLVIVGVSVVGAWLVKQEGMLALRRANERLARGEVPADELINGLLILVAGAFMLTPGFLTDAVGLLLLFPPTRAIGRRMLRAKLSASTTIIGFPGGRFGQGTGAAPGGGVWDVDGWEDPPERPGLP